MMCERQSALQGKIQTDIFGVSFTAIGYYNHIDSFKSVQSKSKIEICICWVSKSFKPYKTENYLS